MGGVDVKENIYNYFKDRPNLFLKLVGRAFSREAVAEASGTLLSRMIAGMESYYMSNGIRAEGKERVKRLMQEAEQWWAKALNSKQEYEKLSKLLSGMSKFDKRYKSTEFAMNNAFDSYLTRMDLGNSTDRYAKNLDNINEMC